MSPACSATDGHDDHIAQIRAAVVDPREVGLVADGLRHRFGEFPVLENRLTDGGMPLADDVVQRSAGQEQFWVIDRPGQHVQFADAVHLAVSMASSALTFVGRAGEHEGERGDDGAALPEVVRWSPIRPACCSCVSAPSRNMAALHFACCSRCG